MTNIRKINKPLKTLMLSATVAVSLIFIPTLSMADNDKYSHHQAKYSTDKTRHHNKGHKISRSHGQKHHYSKMQNRHNKHGLHKSGHHGHRGHNHGHINYVVNDHYHGHAHVFDHLRFMIGLHTDDIDIILHQ